MQLTISSVDYAPEDLYDQVPIVIDLIRQLPGDDRPDYWLGQAQKPIRWIHENLEREISHLVVAARWQGTRIEPSVKFLPVGIAYVIDPTQIDDERFMLSKCSYVAIGMADETGGGAKPGKLSDIISGTIGRSFGLGRDQ